MAMGGARCAAWRPKCRRALRAPRRFAAGPGAGPAAARTTRSRAAPTASTADTTRRESITGGHLLGEMAALACERATRFRFSGADCGEGRGPLDLPGA